MKSSHKGYRILKSYADTFKVLYEKNILKQDLFDKMGKMAKFRNIIVHHYDRVDAEIVVGMLKKNLNDFVDYKNAVIKLLKKDRTA